MNNITVDFKELVNYIREKDMIIDILTKRKNEYQKTIDKIKEWVIYQQQSNENLEPYISTDKLDDILELLEEIE